MANYSKEELQYIATQVQPYLLELVKAMGLDVDGIEVVEEYEGISSLPAYDNRGGTKKLVRVPLRAFAKPATDAIAEIEELILKAEQTIERSESALENTEAALYEIYEIRDELREALQSAQESISALESRVIEVERSETQRVSNENVRVSNENERDTSEAVRKHNEEVRETNEGVRKTAELSRENAEEDRLEAENLRKANEQIRQEQELIRSASEEVRKNAEKERETAKANMISLNEELKTHPPKINDKKNWELWDAVNKIYNDTGITARGHTPIIIDGVWWVWNDDKDDFESTGWAVNSDYVLTKEKIEGVLGGSPMVYVEEWKHTHVPYNGGSMVKFNQEIYIALRDTDVPPVSLLLLGDGIIAKVDEHTYATIGSFDAVGNKADWRKMPLDELRLISREGTLDGAEVDVRNLSGDDVYRFEPNLYIDLLRGVLKGKKVDLTLPKKNVTDALGYTPVTPSEKQELANRIGVLEGEMDEAFSIIDNLWYGVEFDTTIADPTCTRIGNMELHKALPIHNKMRGCLLDDNGAVVKYLNSESWLNETRDGSMGQVMVELPAHFRKFETEGTKRRVKLSTLPLKGFHHVPTMYVSAYEASLQRSTLKLSSVVNTSTDYRGGGNQSDWDNTYRTMLGRPVSVISRTDFRTYARNRKSSTAEWNCMTYDVQKELYWLFVVEYATLNSQAAYNAAKDANGYAQGGLGDGVTTWNIASWGNFNGYYPFVPCGHTDSLGNNSGTVSYNVLDSAGATLKTFSVPRYRGVENPFGHIWQWTDGVNVRFSPTSANGGDDLNKVFVCSNPVSFNDSSYTGYSHVGNEARAEGYAKSHIFGEYGEIIPDAIGGGSTTYLCDYHYTNIPTSVKLRGWLFGGGANSGADAGFACADSNHVPSNADSFIGSRLCFIPQ